MLPSEQMERQSPDKTLFVSADTTVPLHKRYVYVEDEVELTLHSAAEAIGRKFVVTALTSAGVVVNYDATSTDLSTVDAVVEFESTGREYVLTRR